MEKVYASKNYKNGAGFPIANQCYKHEPEPEPAEDPA